MSSSPVNVAASASAAAKSSRAAIAASASLASLVSVLSGVTGSAVGSTVSGAVLSASGRCDWCESTGAGSASVIDAARPARSGGSGIVSAIVAIRVGSCSARRRSKNSSISAWNASTVAPTRWTRVSTTAACASISPSSACLRAAIRASVSFADPRDLGLGPIADDRDVVVGSASEVRCLDLRGGLDLLDRGLRIGDEPGDRLVSRALGGGLHRPTQVGHELCRPASRSGCRHVDHVGRLRLLVGRWIVRGLRRWWRRPPAGRRRVGPRSREA